MRTIRTLSMIILIVVAAYMGSYFVLVQRGMGEVNLGVISWSPVYRFSGPEPCGVAGKVYQPANFFDRLFLRTGMWEERQDLVALIAAELKCSATNSTPPQYGR